MLLVSSDVLYAALLVTYPLRGIAAAQLLHKALGRFAHLSRKVHGTHAFQYRVVNVHRFLTGKWWPEK